jgi:hypothetical protein
VNVNVNLNANVDLDECDGEPHLDFDERDGRLVSQL